MGTRDEREGRLDKLKVLLILLLAASFGLALSLYLLALTFAPGESPLAVLDQIVIRGFPGDLPFVIPLSALLFLSTVLASMVGITYFLVVPEMKNYHATEPDADGKGATAIVMRTLKPDERQVVNVLKMHGGTYVQKYITQEADLSRLKTHRVVAALAERGIVNVEKRGNSNQVTLARWFLDGMTTTTEES
jgi:hypothetical protein